jgi:transposase
MKTVELYARVRRAVLVEGMSGRAAAREFGLARKTVGKMLEYSAPPGYRRQKPVRRPKLGPWQGTIDAILEDDKQRPRKQRHTAKRIFERLRAEHAYTGGYTIVKDYVRSSKIGGQEMFVPLTHAPGEAQADFGEALVVIAGVEQKAHFMAFDLPHSDDCFVQAFPAETTEAFLEGHVRAFEHFGGVPMRILYDNTTLAVARILGDGERKKTRAFSELQSHYLFAEKFGRPAKGNDKGKVENLVGYARRNFMVPIPRAASWEALNEQFVCDAMARRTQRLRGHRETIGERFKRDRAALLPLPAARYEACDKTTARVSSISLVRYRTNDYSVPTQYGHRQVLVKAYVHHIVIVSGSEVIAEHKRSYEREAAIYDPLHYLALLEHKSRALDQAAPLAGWQLPECFAQLRRLLEARLRKHAGREYIQVLRLIEHFAFEEVTAAVEQALALNVIGFDAVRHLVLCRIERRPPRLDMANWPHLPLAQVRTTRTVDYMSLLSMPAAEPPTLEAML